MGSDARVSCPSRSHEREGQGRALSNHQKIMEPMYQSEIEQFRRDSNRAMRARLLRRYPSLAWVTWWSLAITFYVPLVVTYS